MAKGQKFKQEVMEKIIEAFPGSFLYNDGKEARINGMEDGEEVQIKVTLTAAKIPVVQGEDIAMPGTVQPQSTAATIDGFPSVEKKVIEATPEEKQNVSDLLRSLGL